MENTTLPAGKYYVGDLCYVMHPQWDEVCNLMFSNGNTSGVYTLENGVKFAVYSTMYGDGAYEDQQGNCYYVDAGVIGCIRVEDIDDDETYMKGGNIMEFAHDFETFSEDGVIHIGHIMIDTGDDGDPDDDDDDDDEESHEGDEDTGKID